MSCSLVGGRRRSKTMKLKLKFKSKGKSKGQAKSVSMEEGASNMMKSLNNFKEQVLERTNSLYQTMSKKLKGRTKRIFKKK
jgi:hypothetical protein